MRTKDGRPLTDEDLDRLADAAEAGHDLSTWRRRRGRPSLATAPTGAPSPKIEARVPATLRRELTRYAAEDGKSVSQVVRDLAEQYVAQRRAGSR